MFLLRVERTKTLAYVTKHVYIGFPHTPYFNVVSACIVNMSIHKRAFFSLAPEHSKTANIEVGGVGESKLKQS